MLGHEIFDPEIGKRVLVDHTFIVAGGEITKQARNWLGNKLDQSKRSQILFMGQDDILNLLLQLRVVCRTQRTPFPAKKSIDRDLTDHPHRRIIPLNLSSISVTASTTFAISGYSTSEESFMVFSETASDRRARSFDREG
jgi:hypothetical protein